MHSSPLLSSRSWNEYLIKIFSQDSSKAQLDTSISEPASRSRREMAPNERCSCTLNFNNAIHSFERCWVQASEQLTVIWNFQKEVTRWGVVAAVIFGYNWLILLTCRFNFYLDYRRQLFLKIYNIYIRLLQGFPTWHVTNSSLFTFETITAWLPP